MGRDGLFSLEQTDTSFSQRFVLPNQPVFHVLYVTIVEAMFALDGNSYITKWPLERSSFVGKLVLR